MEARCWDSVRDGDPAVNRHHSKVPSRHIVPTLSTNGFKVGCFLGSHEPVTPPGLETEHAEATGRSATINTATGRYVIIDIATGRYVAILKYSYW